MKIIMINLCGSRVSEAGRKGVRDEILRVGPSLLCVCIGYKRQWLSSMCLDMAAAAAAAVYEESEGC